MAADWVKAPNLAPPSPPPLVQLPPYPEMILEAIDALDNENGSNKTAISGYIKRKYGSSLPSSHPSILTAHLARMKTTGELYLSRNKYFRPDDDEEEDPSEPAPADPSSTRGQDSKPEDSVSEDPDGVPDPAPILDADAEVLPVTADVVANVAPASAPVVAADASAAPVKRGRGRPPKRKEPIAEEPDVVPVAVAVVADDADDVPAPAPGDAVGVPVKRGRGRPPKPKDPVSDVAVGAPAAAPVVADDADAVPVKRGRGRPPKPKDPIAEAVAVATRGMPRARGRLPKKAKVAKEAPIGSPAPATGGSADANAVLSSVGVDVPPR